MERNSDLHALTTPWRPSGGRTLWCRDEGQNRNRDMNPGRPARSESCFWLNSMSQVFLNNINFNLQKKKTAFLFSLLFNHPPFLLFDAILYLHI
jgi:hypothetical protein